MIKPLITLFNVHAIIHFMLINMKLIFYIESVNTDFDSIKKKCAIYYSHIMIILLFIIY